VAQYRSQVLVAFREVEDGLLSARLLKEQFETQLRAVEGAKKAAEISLIRFKEGLSSYFEVVDADRTFLENEITAYGLNGQGMVNSVQLIKAMGGGWKPDDAYRTGRVKPSDPARH
jgi:multidrug efflux system outer membrane protein